MLFNKKKKDSVPQLSVELIPADKAKDHDLTKGLFEENQPKIALMAASILIPLAAHATVGLVSHFSSKSQKSHILDLQQEVLLDGCYDSSGALVLKDAFLAITVEKPSKDNKKKTKKSKNKKGNAVKKEPLIVGIWKIIVSQDGTAIRLERKKWQWGKFLQPPERSRLTCQSVKFRDIAIGIEIDSLGENTASWEFVFSSVAEDELSTLIDTTTDWEPAPNKPDDLTSTNVAPTSPAKEPLPKNEEVAPGDEIETTWDDAASARVDDEEKQAVTDDRKYLVPANIRVEVIETTRPHVLAPLLQEGAKAGSTVAGPLSKLLQSKIKV